MERLGSLSKPTKLLPAPAPSARARSHRSGPRFAPIPHKALFKRRPQRSFTARDPFDKQWRQRGELCTGSSGRVSPAWRTKLQCGPKRCQEILIAIGHHQSGWSALKMPHSVFSFQSHNTIANIPHMTVLKNHSKPQFLRVFEAPNALEYSSTSR